MRSMILILGFILIQATATAKPLGMFTPQLMHANLHSKNKNHCDLNHDDSMSMHSFAVTMDCSYQCKKDSQGSSITLARYFDPEEHGLNRGDGYNEKTSPMMTAFTSVFFNWSTKECLDEGVRKCGSLDEVKSADFKTLKSGNWSISEKPTCKQNDRILYSPYDKQFKLERSKATTETPPESSVKIPDGTYLKTPDKGEKPLDCKLKIKGSLCFGDCIIYDDSKPAKLQELPLTLMTKETPESGFSTEEVCGDSLIGAFKGKKLTASVAESICQNYFMNALAKAKAMGTSCAAFRGEANCKNFVKQFSP